MRWCFARWRVSVRTCEIDTAGGYADELFLGHFVVSS